MKNISASDIDTCINMLLMETVMFLRPAVKNFSG